MRIEKERAADLLAKQVRVDKHTTSIDLVELGLLSRVAAGELAHTSTMSFDQPVTPASLLDDRFAVTRRASSDASIAPRASTTIHCSNGDAGPHGERAARVEDIVGDVAQGTPEQRV